MNILQQSRRRFLQFMALGFTWLFSLGKFRAEQVKTQTKTLSIKPEVVVIGAGLGGLCCAAHLARKGFSVTVVEQHSVPGGYASSFRRGRFNFEVSLHATALADNGIGRMLNDLGVSKRLELIPLPAVYRFKSPVLDILVPQKNAQAFARLLSKYFPAEKDGIEHFINELVRVAKAADDIDRYRHNIFKLLFTLPYATLFRIRNKTLARWLDGYVEDPDAREALVALWGYYGLPPSQLSAFYFAVATGSYLREGAYYIKPRSQQLSLALVDVITKAGGKFQFGKMVEKIAVKDNAVTGVVLDNGETLPAQVVVSNANAPDTFHRMLPTWTVPSEYKEKLAQYRPSISSFIVWLGLNQDITPLLTSYNTHYSTGRGPEADYQSCISGDVEHGNFVVALYDHLFEGFSAPGTSTMQILFLCAYEPWHQFEADYRAGRKAAYNAQKNRWTEILIRRVEQNLVPGLSAIIEEREAATPLTNWRFTRNYEGAIYGFEQSTNNAFYNRIQNRTPVKGLYLASAWGNPGGGYAAVLTAGKMVYEDIIDDWGTG